MDTNQDKTQTDGTQPSQQQSVVVQKNANSDTDNLETNLSLLNAQLEALVKNTSGSGYNFNSSTSPFGQSLYNISQRSPQSLNGQPKPIPQHFTLKTSNGNAVIPNEKMLVERGQNDGNRVFRDLSNYAQLVLDQKKAFSEFRDALRQVAENLMTIAKMRDTANRVVSMQQLATMHGGQIEDVARVQYVSHQTGSNPVQSDNLYEKIQEL